VRPHKRAQRRWAGESCDVKRRWRWQGIERNRLVGGDHVDLAALVAQGLCERIASRKRLREEEAGAVSEAAEGVDQAILALVRGHEIDSDTGLLERACGFCAHSGDSWASRPSRKRPPSMREAVNSTAVLLVKMIQS